MDQSTPDFIVTVPPGDDRERRVCRRCNFIDYVNPKIVVGSVATDANGRILMCRRAIDPRKGYWTIPAGFLEEGESAEQGAAREALEEATADLFIDRLLAIYSIPRISQIQLIYRARLVSETVAAGPESEEVALMACDELPWGDLAFPSVHWALQQHRSVIGQEDFPPFTNPDGAFAGPATQGL